MRYHCRTLLRVFALCVVFFSERAGTAEAQSLSAQWKDGFRYESDDKNISIKVGGRIYNDWTFWLDADEALEDEETGVGELEDSVEFRTARLYTAGSIYNLEYKAEYDFAGGDSEFKDVWLGLKGVPLVNSLRVGHQKEPFGLEELTSSRFITFLERGLTSALIPSFNAGIRAENALLDKKLVLSAGAFKEVDEFGEGSGDENYNLTGRIAALPYYYQEGKRLVHLGLAYSYKNIGSDSLRFRTRPEIHDAPRFVDTNDVAAESANLVGAELALVLQSLSVQSEYVQALVNTIDASDADLSSFYVMVSYFLTGETRPYKKGEGVFDRVHPLRDYIASEPGLGAWEVAARFSQIDLEDSIISGGKLLDYTLGLNWYLHPNARIMLNLIHSDEDDLGDAQALTMRFQVDF